MHEFTFRMAERKDTDKLYGFLLSQQLNYKRYTPWLKKAIEEFYYGLKQVMLGFSGNILVSSLMFQSCKHLEGFCELKNGRTVKELERRLFLSFLIRQVEAISRQEGKLGVICDARSDRIDVLNLLRSNGYREITRADLYGEGYEDIVMIKPFTKNLIY